MKFTSTAAFLLAALLGTVSFAEAAALKDPKTLKALADLKSFCKSSGKTAACFNIRKEFQQSTLAKAAKANPCGRTTAANKLLETFPGNAEAKKLANEMHDAPINVIPGLAKKNKNTLTRRDPKKKNKDGKKKKNKGGKNKRVGKGQIVKCSAVKFNGSA